MSTASHKEKLLSGLGGAFSILIVFWLTRFIEEGMHSHLLFIASMGATAVLLFAAPHSPLSQPWNVVGGHVVSALVGLIVHQLISNQILGGALAVGLAITAMYYMHCLHPPGGATSLIAIIGGSTVNNFGYIFILFPVGLGAVLMVLVAVIFNYPFQKRRYPLTLTSQAKTYPGKQNPDPAYPDISHADLVVALSEIETYVDISEEDLLRIYEIASRRPHPELAK